MARYDRAPEMVVWVGFLNEEFSQGVQDFSFDGRSFEWVGRLLFETDASV